MQAAVLEAPRRFALVEKPVPEIGSTDILVRSEICGLCTSELDIWEGKNKTIKYPRFMGHEVSGYVEAVGSRVKDFRRGDRVATYSEGQGFAQYTAVPAAWAVKIADDVPFEHALGEPIACSINGVRKATPQLTDSVAIVGCGFMGLIMLQAFRAAGVGLLIAIDRRESALELARRFGATHTINPATENPVRAVRKLTDRKGVDIGVEGAGIQQTLDLTTKLVRMEGKLEVFGFHQGKRRRVDWGYWNWMAFQIINGHTRSQHVYVEGMRIGFKMMENRQLDMEPLVTHRFPLSDINHAFETASSKQEGFVKGVVTLNT
ncbi:MAG TPA: zinc-binding dehydrogenase [Rhodothermales bacterium]|nr:zinc-binding dehydrogenase [Rhodothermales bacterium]